MTTPFVAPSSKFGTPGQYAGQVLVVGPDGKPTNAPAFLTRSDPPGSYNFVLGNNNTIGSQYVIAFGEYMNLSAGQITAFGVGCTATSPGDSVFGYTAQVSGSGTAYGYNADGRNGGAAFGYLATANGSTSCAFGSGAYATGGSAFALGGSAAATGFNSIALGYQANNATDHSFTYGSSAWPIGLVYPTAPAAGHALEPRGMSSANTRRRTSGLRQGLADATDSIYRGFCEIYVCDYTGVDRMAFRAESDGTQALISFFGGSMTARRAAIPDTAGADVATLEAEVNKLKALIRAFNLMAP